MAPHRNQHLPQLGDWQAWADIARADQEAHGQSSPPEFKGQAAGAGPVIYFVRTKAGPIKVGTSTQRCFRDRFALLVNSAAEPLELIGLMEGDRWQEQKVHERFKEHRLHGEWFAPVQSLLDFINTRARGPLFDNMRTNELRRAARTAAIEGRPWPPTPPKPPRRPAKRHPRVEQPELDL